MLRACVCDMYVCLCLKPDCLGHCLIGFPSKKPADTEGWALGTLQEALTLQEEPLSSQETPSLMVRRRDGKSQESHKPAEWSPTGSEQCGLKKQSILVGIRPPGRLCGPVESCGEICIRMEIEFSTSRAEWGVLTQISFDFGKCKEIFLVFSRQSLQVHFSSLE